MSLFLIALTGLALLVVATVFARRTGIAAPLLLLGLGIGVSLVPTVPDVTMDPEWILAGVLPPLLYASSVKMPVVDLRRSAGLLVWLSVVIVIVTALGVGALVHLLVPAIPFPLGVALGAVVSPTDAVAATSIGKRLGLPHRLMTILEGESLFNDAAALVTLRTALAALASFSLVGAIADFLWASAGGAVVGLVVGWVAIAVRQRLGDPVLNTTVSFAVPWVAFVPAEEIRASGIIAVVVAGVVSGHRGRLRLTAADRTTEATTWATVSFVLEHAVFLLMGMQLTSLVAASRADGGLDRLPVVCLAVFVLLVVVRAVGMGVPILRQRLLPDRTTRYRERLSFVGERLREFEEQERIDADRAETLNRRLARSRADLDFAERQPLTRRGGLVLAWAGMRGVVTLAGAQTIEPEIGGVAVPFRTTIVLIAFVVAVLTLVLFGGTLPWLIRRLKFATPSASQRHDALVRLLAELGDTVVERLGPLDEQVVEGEPIPPEVAEAVTRRFVPIALAARAGGEGPPTALRDRSLVVQRRYLDAFRAALAEEQLIGAYPTEVMRTAQRLLDREEQRIDGWR